MKKYFKFVKKNDLEINLEYLGYFKNKNLLSFENLWDLKNYFFYYKKRYRTIEAFDLKDFKLYLKKYENNLKEAQNEWGNIILLWKKGFPTLIPVVFGIKENKAIVGTKELGIPSSLELLKNNLISPKILLKNISKFLALFHENNLFHQDCYIGHFHYDVKKEIFYIMDVARIKYNPLFKLKYLIKDLAQFKYSLMEIFKDSYQYWWNYFWDEYNTYRTEKLGKLIEFLIDKKTQKIDKHTKKVIQRGGEGVITYYKK